MELVRQKKKDKFIRIDICQGDKPLKSKMG